MKYEDKRANFTISEEGIPRLFCKYIERMEEFGYADWYIGEMLAYVSRAIDEDAILGKRR